MSVQTTYPTNMPIGLEGSLQGTGPHYCLPVINANASAEIAFGKAVKFGGSLGDNGVVSPAAGSDAICGIAVHSDVYSTGTTTSDLGTTGLRPNVVFDAIQKGRILVLAEVAVAVGDRLFVRAITTGGAPQYVGGPTNASDSSNNIDCTKQGIWLSSTSAGGQLAVLEVDFVNKP